MAIIRRFFPGDSGESESLTPIAPGESMPIRDISEGGIGRLIWAQCAVDGLSASVLLLRSSTLIFEGADMYLPIEIPETELEFHLEPGEEVVFLMKRTNLVSGEYLLRLDPAARLKSYH